LSLVPPAAALPVGGRPGLGCPFATVAPRGCQPLLSPAEVKTLWKVHEDEVEDAQREVEEERLVAATAEDMRDMAKAQAARMRFELGGAGHSLSSLLFAGAKSWSEFSTLTLTS
jgi:hypothetical protein